MDDATGLAEALLGLNGFRVLTSEETSSEVIVTVETTADFVGCSSCGVRAEAKDRVRVDIRDLPCFGRPARLVWLKRRWRCADPDCAAKTWTEGTEHVAPRAVLTLRAGAEATRQVGELALPVAVVTRELGVCWWTVMDAVVLHGTPLVDEPGRVKRVRALGIDETSFLSATRAHHTIYVHGPRRSGSQEDHRPGGRERRPDLRRWCAKQDPAQMRAIRVVATDLAESYRRGTSPHLDHAVRVRGRSFPRDAHRQPLRRQGAPACLAPALMPPIVASGPAQMERVPMPYLPRIQAEPMTSDRFQGCAKLCGPK